MKEKEGESLGIYIHIPFCIKKCSYCDFLSFQGSEAQKEKYVSALIREIMKWGEFYGKKGRNYQVSTIYFGGGTPSVLEPLCIEKILCAVREYYTVKSGMEITIECNPKTADYDKFISYLKMGINRLSIGIQSAHNSELKQIGRIHTWEDFLQTYHAAETAGFSNISLDIMSALPDQTYESYHETLEKIIRLNPKHISSYSLIIEENTPFFDMYRQGLLHLPEEDLERKMYYHTNELLKKNGYHRYEISNYAKTGYESRHNSSYWKRKNYLGFGLGASSLIDNIRFQNISNFTQYIERCFQENVDFSNNIEEILPYYKEAEILSVKEQMEEFMFLGLRMTDGISKAEFKKLYKKDFDEVYGETVSKLIKMGLICCKGDKVRLTDRGIDVSNQVLAEFLLDDTVDK